VNREQGTGNSKRRYRLLLWLILGLALGLRLAAFVPALQSNRGFIDGDGLYYHILAKNILAGQYQLGLLGTPDEARINDQKFLVSDYYFSTVPKNTPSNFWSPGYPAFLAFWYWIFGVKPEIPMFINVLLGIVGCWLIYRIGSHIAGPAVGIMAAAGLAVHPAAIRSAVRLETEMLSLALFLLVLLLVLRWRDAQGNLRLSQAVFFGVILAAMFYIRSTYLLLLGTLVLSIMWKPRWKHLLTATVLVGTFALAMLPWAIRNKQQTGVFTIFDNRGINFIYGDFVHKFNLPYRYYELKGKTEVERCNEEKEFFMEELRKQPSLVLKWAGYNLKTWLPLHEIHGALIIVDLLAVLLVLYGFSLLRRDWFALLPILIFIVIYYGTVLLLMKGYEYRFHLPTDILLSIFLATAFLQLAKRWTGGRKIGRLDIPV
jgi:4-amino-4-deoxy-L-arabinose transferase-like glycosyltransferase